MVHLFACLALFTRPVRKVVILVSSAVAMAVAVAVAVTLDLTFI